MFSGCPSTCVSVGQCGPGWRHSPTGLPSTSSFFRVVVLERWLRLMTKFDRFTFDSFRLMPSGVELSAAHIFNFICCFYAAATTLMDGYQ